MTNVCPHCFGDKGLRRRIEEIRPNFPNKKCSFHPRYKGIPIKEVAAIVDEVFRQHYGLGDYYSVPRQDSDMCGRSPFGKEYFDVLTAWSVAGMCPAFDCGVSQTAAGHDEVRRSGSIQNHALFALVAKRIIPIRVSTLVITPSAPHQLG